ncbi:Arc family DNA-binding protein [Methylobacterium dankookense]|nr:Arc family DNA-binding protein [Methylobacterium dankookense]
MSTRTHGGAVSREDPHFRLRLPEDIRQKVKISAERNRRSMTGEIVFHLANALGDESKPAAGHGPGKANPAAVTHDTALPGGPAVHG